VPPESASWFGFLSDSGGEGVDSLSDDRDRAGLPDCVERHKVRGSVLAAP